VINIKNKFNINLFNKNNKINLNKNKLNKIFKIFLIKNKLKKFIKVIYFILINIFFNYFIYKYN
jgi:hypothetical protein